VVVTTTDKVEDKKQTTDKHLVGNAEDDSNGGNVPVWAG
jgi:hypothetical protein